MKTTKKKAAAKSSGQKKPTLRTTATARSGDTKPGRTSAARAAKKAAAGKTATAPKRQSAEETATRSAGGARRLKEARAAAEAAIEAALDKKALMPVLIDVSGEATYTDFIAVVSGRSDRQVDAVAEGVTMAMKQRGWTLLGREGAGNGRWTLLDFGDFVLHVFYHPVREFYDIEGLWIDAPRVKLKVPPEAQHVQDDVLYESV